MVSDNKAENINRCSCRSGRMRRFLIPALLLLISEKSSHGYELTEKYTEFGFTEASADPGAIYRTLKLLASEGFVISQWDTDKPGPAKKIYSITDEGLELLSSWAEEIKERKKYLEFFLKRYNKLK